MKKLIIGFLLTALFALLIPGSIDAQTNHGRLQMELDRTDEIIDQAMELIGNSDNPVAAMAFNHAIQLQEQAKRAFMENALQMSFNLTTKARAQANSAIAIARQVDQLEGAVQRKLERARELLETIKDLAAGNDVSELEELFHTARINLERAWEFYRGRQYRPAIKLADQVLQVAERILTVARQLEHGRHEYERGRENNYRILELASDLIEECSSDAARQKLEHARQAALMADDLFEKNRVRASIQALHRASSLAKSAMRDCNGWEHLERIHSQLSDELTNLLDTLSEFENRDGNVIGSIRQLLELASDQLQIAADSMGRQELESAQAALKGADLALKQAKRQISRINN